MKCREKLLPIRCCLDCTFCFCLDMNGDAKCGHPKTHNRAIPDIYSIQAWCALDDLWVYRALLAGLELMLRMRHGKDAGD